MTHSIDAPLPPSATNGRSGVTGGGGSPSTPDLARDEAKNLGQTAQQAGSQVASTAADQAKQVAHETQRQAKDLVDQGRSQVREQASTQQQKAAQGLSSLAQELRGLADGGSQGAPGPARDLLQQASGKVEEFSSWLQHREPADLLAEVRGFARRRPGTFLLGAALLGVAAGRLTRGVTEVHRDSGPSGQHRMAGTGYPATYVDPAPTYSGYTDTGYAAGTTPGYGTTGTPGYETTGTPGGAPLPPPPYGTAPPVGSAVPPTTPAGWDETERGRGV